MHQMSDLRRQRSLHQTLLVQTANGVNEMRGLYEKFKSTEKILQQHWRDWVSVQDAIACLGVEALGTKDTGEKRQGVDVRSSKKRLSLALGRYEKRLAEMAEVENTVRHHRDNICKGTLDVLQKLEAQEKVRATEMITIVPTLIHWQFVNLT